jgi:hypothetical protein
MPTRPDSGAALPTRLTNALIFDVRKQDIIRLPTTTDDLAKKTCNGDAGRIMRERIRATDAVIPRARLMVRKSGLGCDSQEPEVRDFAGESPRRRWPLEISALTGPDGGYRVARVPNTRRCRFRSSQPRARTSSTRWLRPDCSCSAASSASSIALRMKPTRDLSVSASRSAERALKS